MRKPLLTILVLGAALAFAVPSGYARTVRPLRALQRPNARAGAPNAQVPIQALIVDFYISRLPVEVELNDDQMSKVLPLLRQWLEERRVLEPRRTRAMNQLRQAILRSAPEEELSRLIHDADEAASQQQASREKFLTNVDPLLTVLQRAKLRVFQETIEQRIIRMIEAARVAAQQQRNAQQQKNPPLH